MLNITLIVLHALRRVGIAATLEAAMEAETRINELAMDIPGAGIVCVLELDEAEVLDEGKDGENAGSGFGSRVWPLAHACALRLIECGVQGCSVLELGCGCGFVALAARQAGATEVLATDVSSLSLALATASGERQQRPGGARPSPGCRRSGPTSGDLPLGRFAAMHFDVESDGPLPRASGPPARAFDFVVFSDALVERGAARAFGRRAAQAFAAGSTVIVADPGWRQTDFFDALRGECRAIGIPEPTLHPEPVGYPEWVFEVALSKQGPDGTRPTALGHAKVDFLDPFLLVLRALPTQAVD